MIFLRVYNILWVIKNIIKVMIICSKKYDHVVIGGGQLILSNGNFGIAIFLWSLWLSFFKQRFYFVGVGCGTEFSFFDKFFFRFSLKRARGIFFRDEKSKIICKSVWGIESADVIPDVVFFLSEELNDLSNLSNLSIERKTLLGVFEYEAFLTYSKDKPSRNLYYDFIYSKYKKYIPNIHLFYTTQNDRVECEKFKQFMHDKHGIELNVLDISDLESLLCVISTSSLLISGRMHALLLALLMSVPILPIEVSPKISSFNDEYMRNSIDIKSKTSELKDVFLKKIMRV